MMLKQCAFMLLVLCAAAPAQAGLFSDDEAHSKIQQLEARIASLVVAQEDALKQQTRTMLDLQAQIEALNVELRKLRGQNEELAHGLQNAEKREKDFYVDLDTRLRHFESKEDAQPADAGVAAVVAVPADPNDPSAANRAYEAAYGLFRSGNHAGAIKAFQEFVSKYPESAHVANASYWLGTAQFALKDYKGALTTYQGLLKNYPNIPKSPDILFNIAGCQQELKQDAEAQKTLKLLISKHPDSELAAKAKKLLATTR